MESREVGSTVPPMSLRTVVVIMNEASGRGSGDDDVAVIEQAFADVGIDATILRLRPADIAEAIGSLWAGDPRPDAVVVAGGDGTVNCAANAVVGTDIVLGVLPAGTFNHFAKDIGMPVDVVEAVRALAGAEPTQLDVGEVNGRVFVNNAVLGIYPEMVAIRDRLRSRHGWGKVRAVPVAAVAVLRTFPTHRVDLTAPGGVVRRRVRTPLVFVGNGEFDGTGLGTPTRGSLQDGKLSVGIALPTTRMGLVRAALRFLGKGDPDENDLDTIELPQVIVTSRASRVKVALDGEVLKMTSPLDYRSRPGALRVLVPRPADAPDPEVDAEV